ncbi:MAG: hypothetical protein OXN97_06630 [Bryobacterales bacterium]|nr:hypothetical protein [Bryobacterales bacterium]
MKERKPSTRAEDDGQLLGCLILWALFGVLCVVGLVAWALVAAAGLGVLAVWAPIAAVWELAAGIRRLVQGRKA